MTTGDRCHCSDHEAHERHLAEIASWAEASAYLVALEEEEGD
jgi:hypothetical protein